MLDLIAGFALGFAAALVPPIRSRVIGFAQSAWQYVRRAISQGQ